MKELFRQAAKYMQSSSGYIKYGLLKCIGEDKKGFSDSDEYQKWKELLRHFCDLFSCGRIL
ncbi:hypothetical protein ACFSTE_06640 [Aquimarina hainanensis]|uniref:Four helix bundle protein n=1 Tax=Aquimarina hainanensis TaxID=1578017 RepID=A0ABW5N7N6_9FLAO